MAARIGIAVPQAHVEQPTRSRTNERDIAPLVQLHASEFIMGSRDSDIATMTLSNPVVERDHDLGFRSSVSDEASAH